MTDICDPNRGTINYEVLIMQMVFNFLLSLKGIIHNFLLLSSELLK